MPSTSKKQHNFMAAIAHNPAFAKKVGIPQSVGKDFNQADKGKKFKEGGLMKHDDIKQDMPMMKKVAGLEATKIVNKHEKKMHGMAKGGVTRADGCVKKGHTKGKMISMKSGGMC
jgi:hypothetical protein